MKKLRLIKRKNQPVKLRILSDIPMTDEHRSFVIERSTDGVNFEEIGESVDGKYTDRGASANTVYHYRIRSKA